MKIKATSPLFEPIECNALVTAHHPRSCFGRPVLVLLGMDGGAVDPLQAEFAGYEILEATADERSSLAAAGYRLKGLADE